MTVAPRLPKRLQRLQRQARLRNCSLKILPPHFSRRKENTSCYDIKDRVSTEYCRDRENISELHDQYYFQVIKWHVLLKFPNINKKMILPSVSEKTKLLSLLTEFVEWRSLDDPSDPFQMYRSVSYGGLSLYLKAESAPGQATNRRFYPLDLRRSLKTNLQDTVIVEHPIIYVVFKTDEHLFRDEADDIHVPIKEKAADSETSSDSVGLGEVMSQTEDMQSDPEAYKKYFDFYLKYYTTKYAKHGVSAEDSLPPKPPPSAPPKVNSNTFPNRNRGTPTPSFPRTLPPSQGPSVSSMPRTVPPSQKRNFIRENNFSRASSDLVETNRRNQEQAQSIKKQLKTGNPLGGLVDYDDSDSD